MLAALLIILAILLVVVAVGSSRVIMLSQQKKQRIDTAPPCAHWKEIEMKPCPRTMPPQQHYCYLQDEHCTLAAQEPDHNLGNILDNIFSKAALHFLRRQQDVHISVNVMHQNPCAILRNFPSVVRFRQEYKDNVLPSLQQAHATYSDAPAEMRARYRTQSGTIIVMDWRMNYGFLVAMRPVIRDVLRPLLQQGSPKYDVVLHFRCSDVPFQRGSMYRLLCYRWYTRALAMVRTKVRSIAIVSCHMHQSRRQNRDSCQKYVDRLAEHVRTLKSEAKVHTVCASVDEDFSTMAQAPVLISSGSSMSYMAGLVSEGTTIFPSTSQKHPYRNVPEGWVVLDSEKDVLRDNEVVDYHDVERVHAQLSR
jgi:hypothetical protein